MKPIYNLSIIPDKKNSLPTQNEAARLFSTRYLPPPTLRVTQGGEKAHLELIQNHQI